MATNWTDYHRQQLQILRNEIKAATSTMRAISKADPVLFDQLNELAESCTFSTRRYSNCSFTWPQHERLGAVDPWQGTRFPKCVLCILFLQSA